MRKSDNYRYREEMTLEKTIKKRNKELMQKIKQRRLKNDNFTGSNKKVQYSYRNIGEKKK